MNLSPGIRYFLIPNIGAIFAPPLISIAASYALIHFFNFDLLPFWLRTLLLVLSWPTAFAFSLIYKHVRDARRAAALGAVPVPAAPYKIPGGIDLLLKVVQEAKTGYLADFPEGVTKEVGTTWATAVLWQRKVFTVEPEHIKLILATEFNNYEKGPGQRDQLRSMLGTGVFNSDGEMWKFHRSMTRPFFSRDRISHFELFGRHADAAIISMKARFAEGAALDFQDLVSRFTLDSATEFLFGHCVHSLNAGLPYPLSHPSHTLDTGDADKFAKAFTAAQEALAARSRFGGGWALRELFGDLATPYMEEINKFIDPILAGAITKRKAELESGTDLNKKDVSDEDTLLSHLIRYTQDPVILKDETLNIMIAGRDTTAATLTFLFYLLSQHPDVLKRLRAEILHVVGPSRYPTYDDLREMKYLRAVINETLRLFPPVPFDARANINETTLPPNVPGGRPLYLPPDTIVIYSVFLMHRRQDLWGPDALEFDPDRFLDERLHKYLTPHPFIFLPFNAGPRICLGQQFAYNESSFMAIRLLQSFETVSLARDAQPADSLPPAEWAQGTGRKKVEKIVPKSHLTMYVKGGLWLKLGEANTGKSESE